LRAHNAPPWGIGPTAFRPTLQALVLPEVKSLNSGVGFTSTGQTIGRGEAHQLFHLPGFKPQFQSDASES